MLGIAMHTTIKTLMEKGSNISQIAKATQQGVLLDYRA